MVKRCSSIEIDLSNEQSVNTCLKKLSYNQVQFNLLPIFLNGDVGGVDSSILNLVAQCAEIKSFLKATELEESEIFALKWTSFRWCQDKNSFVPYGMCDIFCKDYFPELCNSGLLSKYN